MNMVCRDCLRAFNRKKIIGWKKMQLKTYYFKFKNLVLQIQKRILPHRKYSMLDDLNKNTFLQENTKR